MTISGTLRSARCAMDLASQMMHIDNRGFNPGDGKTVEHVVDQRLARHFDQWLRRHVAQGPHPCAESRSEDHGLGRQIWVHVEA